MLSDNNDISEASLGSSQTFAMEPFYKTSEQLLALKCFAKGFIVVFLWVPKYVFAFVTFISVISAKNT